VSDTTVEFEYEWDAYYSSVSWIKGFAQQEVPEISDLTELSMYHTLLTGSLLPDFLVLELSVNPLPILGVYLREQQPSLYEKGQGNGESDTLMLGVRRDRIDFTQNEDDLMRDFAFEYRLDVLQTNFRPHMRF